MTQPDETIDHNLGLWWRNTPAYAGHRVGCFGIPDSTGQIREAESRLREKGCTIAIGPMDGSTWKAHRAVIESDGSPPFLLEPITPLHTATLFRQEDFEILAEYSSSELQLGLPSPCQSRIESRLAGIQFRHLEMARFDDELRNLYALSTKAFVDNFLYAPISESEFVAQYRALQSHLTPDCVFIAEHENEIIGFVFGYPDRNRFVVKTLAVLPRRAFAGLGTLLVHRIQARAFQNGFSTAIHALQRANNQSLRISKRFHARIFRRYALFAKTL